jgi:hypothetical protein
LSTLGFPLGETILFALLLPLVRPIRQIRPAVIFTIATRVDAIVVGNWIVTGFMKVAVCLLTVSRGLAEWAGVSEYRPLVLPLGRRFAEGSASRNPTAKPIGHRFCGAPHCYGAVDPA